MRIFGRYACRVDILPLDILNMILMWYEMNVKLHSCLILIEEGNILEVQSNKFSKTQKTNTEIMSFDCEQLLSFAIDNAEYNDANNDTLPIVWLDEDLTELFDPQFRQNGFWIGFYVTIGVILVANIGICCHEWCKQNKQKKLQRIEENMSVVVGNDVSTTNEANQPPPDCCCNVCCNVFYFLLWAALLLVYYPWYHVAAHRKDSYRSFYDTNCIPIEIKQQSCIETDWIDEDGCCGMVHPARDRYDCELYRWVYEIQMDQLCDIDSFEFRTELLSVGETDTCYVGKRNDGAIKVRMARGDYFCGCCRCKCYKYHARCGYRRGTMEGTACCDFRKRTCCCGSCKCKCDCLGCGTSDLLNCYCYAVCILFPLLLFMVLSICIALLLDHQQYDPWMFVNA